MLKVHTANINSADQIALTTLYSHSERDSTAQRSSCEADLSLEFTVATARDRFAVPMSEIRPNTMLKVHMANIKSADQIALTTTLLAFRTWFYSPKVEL